ncbi:u3 small nucleolar RNA-associated protein 18 [Anaeramoeba flamelloides]|uniref:U3 small nucleolar RNA-associated protein 18 n=1 Tax=Anaeramoeba flamelloides TaxID=1746091 RepID=A0AAV7ZT88_9EUKA|nr:u3 small nucleolar RNA-associated protein 18 [Anaeramoeba flamelloides]
MSKKNSNVLKNRNNELTSLLFGSPFKNKTKTTRSFSERAKTKQSTSEKNTEKPTINIKPNKQLTPAWFDEDDDDFEGITEDDQISQNQENTNEKNFEKTTNTKKKTKTLNGEKITINRNLAKTNEIKKPQRKWAKIKNKDKTKTNEDLLANQTSTSSSLLRLSKKLPKKMISLTKLKDLNWQSKNTSAITSVDFHPGGEICSVGSSDRTLRLFQCDGVKNTMLKKITFSDLPIKESKFCLNGEQIICAGDRQHMYIYDLRSDNVSKITQLMNKKIDQLKSFCVSDPLRLICLVDVSGSILMIDQRSKQWVKDLVPPMPAEAISFVPNTNKLISTGKSGEILVWDVRNRQCVDKFEDIGVMNSTSIAASGNLKYYATGSTSGVVTIWNAKKREPLKSLMNLTTNSNLLQFNHDSQMLMMASSEKKNALRFVHIPSFTVFSNFPDPQTYVNKVTSFNISNDSTKIVIGNNSGNVYLYRNVYYQKW